MQDEMKGVMVSLLAVLVVAGATCPGKDESRLESFSMRDQHGKTHRQVFPARKVLVLTVADKKGAEQLERWIRKVKGRYGKRVDLAGVADVTKVPKALRKFVTGEFRKQVTHAVMLDFDGRVVRRLSPAKGKANLFVVGKDGGVACHVAGEWSPAAEAALFAGIERAMSR